MYGARNIRNRINTKKTKQYYNRKEENMTMMMMMMIKNHYRNHLHHHNIQEVHKLPMEKILHGNYYKKYYTK